MCNFRFTNGFATLTTQGNNQTNMTHYFGKTEENTNLSCIYLAVHDFIPTQRQQQTNGNQANLLTQPMQ